MTVLRVAALAAVLLGAIPAQTLRFAVIGDSGAGDANQLAVARQMEMFHVEHPWTLVLMLGDNIYEEGHPQEFDRRFKNVYRNLTSRGVRFHAVLGNHDRVHPLSRKGMAQVEDEAFGYVGRQDEYELAAGPKVDGRDLVRFMALNSEAWLEEIDAGGRPEARLRRLRAWLAESDRYHWNFVLLHHPLYSFVAGKSRFFGLFRGGYGHGPEEEFRRILEPELKGKVDAVFSGHEHFYQKIRPQGGIHYFISGGGSKIRKGAVKKHEQVEFAAEALHFLDIELSASALRYTAISGRGAPLHAGTIPKKQQQSEVRSQNVAAPAPSVGFYSDF